MINNDIKEVLLKLNIELENGLSSSELANLIRKKCIELGLTYQELYKLFFDKMYLVGEVNNEINAASRKMKMLSKEIDELKVFKRELSSLICELYGHEFIDYDDTNIQTCKVCGKSEFISCVSKKISLDINK